MVWDGTERRVGPLSRRDEDFICGEHGVMCAHYKNQAKEIEEMKKEHASDVAEIKKEIKDNAKTFNEELRYQRRQLVQTLVSALIAAAGTVCTFAVLFFQFVTNK